MLLRRPRERVRTLPAAGNATSDVPAESPTLGFTHLQFEAPGGQ